MHRKANRYTEARKTQAVQNSRYLVGTQTGHGQSDRASFGKRSVEPDGQAETPTTIRYPAIGGVDRRTAMACSADRLRYEELRRDEVPLQAGKRDRLSRGRLGELPCRLPHGYQNLVATTCVA